MNPSLTVRQIEGQALVHCHREPSCPVDSVMAALGLTTSDLYDEPKGASYRYTNRAGQVTRTVHRSPDKKFRQTGDTTAQPQLYHLPQVIAAVEAATTVHVVEGEKDVHALESLGAVATTAPMGAGNWGKVDTGPLKGADVVIVPDQDEAGKRWLADVLASLRGHASGVKVATPKVGKDAADHVAAGHSLDELDPRPPAETADDPRDELFEREAAHARAVAAEAGRLRVRRDAERVVRADDRPKTPEPTGRSLRELLADPDEPAEYRIDGLMPTGARVLFAGAAKAGKTSTLQALLGALANGGLFLGRFAVEPPAGRIAYLDFELGDRQARRWLRRAGVRDPDRIEFYDLKGREAHFDLRRPEVRTWWADELRSKRIGFPIFDCLTPVLRTLGIDENTEAATIAYGYSAMCIEAGIDESILVHHAGHGAERSRGDSALLGWSAVNWTQVRRTEGNRDDRFLVAEGRDVDLPESLLAFDLSTRVLTLVGGSRTETAADELIPDVLAWLTDNPASSGRAIETALVDDHAGRGRQRVRTAVARSVESGRVVRIPGPRNAQLHSVALSEQNRAREASAPSAPVVRPRTESECASAPYGRTALTDEQEVLSAPRTQTGALDAEPPWRRLLLAKDAAIAEGVITEDQVTPREYLVRYGVAA